jgi:hypothetical protein
MEGEKFETRMAGKKYVPSGHDSTSEFAFRLLSGIVHE